jgi:site-specific DNA recombinase
VADLGDPALREGIAGLTATRDQALADAERAQAMAESVGQQAITPAMVSKFARIARERIRIEGSGYRRDHLRALAQRVEVADGEVRIMGSKGDLLRTLAAVSGVNPATPGVCSSVLRWRRGCPSNKCFSPFKSVPADRLTPCFHEYFVQSCFFLHYRIQQPIVGHVVG